MGNLNDMKIKNKFERYYMVTHECDVEYNNKTWKVRFSEDSNEGTFYVLNEDLEVPRWVEGGFHPDHDSIYEIYHEGDYEEIE